jgi:hypothetical protein
MYTIVETPTFVDDAKRLWSEEERGAFCAWLAANPGAGSLIPGSGGLRKVRWTRSGSGKQGGVRVFYFTRISEEEIWLLVIYSKAVKGNIPAQILKSVREEVENE